MLVIHHFFSNLIPWTMARIKIYKKWRQWDSQLWDIQHFSSLFNLHVPKNDATGWWKLFSWSAFLSQKMQHSLPTARCRVRFHYISFVGSYLSCLWNRDLYHLISFISMHWHHCFITKNWPMHTIFIHATLLALCYSYMFQLSGSHPQGVRLTQFHSWINRMCIRCKILEVKTYLQVTINLKM